MASHGVLVLRLGTPSGARTMKLQTCDNVGDSALAVWELLTGWHNPARGRAGALVRHSGNACCHPSC